MTAAVMRALLLERPGDYRTLRLAEIPVPGPEAGEIRVRVGAAGLNPVDYKLARSGFPGWQYPFILGLDVAGVVDAVGAGVEQWRPGDRVVYHGDLRKPGGFAEYAVTTAHTVSALPQGLDFTTAASLPCAGFTAYHALYRRLRIEAGQTILIHAAAGGVGGFATQLARHAGLRVLATCSAGNVEYVRSLGAETVIDYRAQDVETAVLAATDGQGVDAVLETLGPEQAGRDLKLLVFNGSMACLLGFPDLSGLLPFTTSPSLHEVSLGGAHRARGRRAQEDLAWIGREFIALLSAGAIRPLPVTRLSLTGIPQGLAQLEGGHVRGKLVAELASL